MQNSIKKELSLRLTANCKSLTRSHTPSACKIQVCQLSDFPAHQKHQTSLATKKITFTLALLQANPRGKSHFAYTNTKIPLPREQLCGHGANFGIKVQLLDASVAGGWRASAAPGAGVAIACHRDRCRVTHFIRLRRMGPSVRALAGGRELEIYDGARRGEIILLRPRDSGGGDGTDGSLAFFTFLQ